MNTAAERTLRHYAQLRSRRLLILGEELSVLRCLIARIVVSPTGMACEFLHVLLDGTVEVLVYSDIGVRLHPPQLGV